MTDAKKPGKGSPLDFAVDQQSRLTLPAVRLAVERGNGVLAFQPVVQAQRTSRPAFYEGLIRIIDESGRMVPLRDFMPVAELGELGRQGFVGLHDEHRPLQLFRQPCHRGRLASTGGTQQNDVLLTALDPLLQLCNGLRLVARRLELADDVEGRNAASDVGNWTHEDNPSSMPPRCENPGFQPGGNSDQGKNEEQGDARSNSR